MTVVHASGMKKKKLVCGKHTFLPLLQDHFFRVHIQNVYAPASEYFPSAYPLGGRLDATV